MPTSPDNRLHLNYRTPPARKVTIPQGIVDIHNHAGEPALTAPMVEAALAYGITHFLTMAPLEHVASLKQKFPNQFHFVAVPNWKRDMPVPDDAFFKDWIHRLEIFRSEHHAKLFKIHNAPGTKRRWQTSLDDPRILDLCQHAYNLGYHFMTHVGDPKAWYYGKGVYADGTFGTSESQFDQLERLLDKYPDRLHLGAHMGGSLEMLPLLAKRMEKYPHYLLDTSATRWMVRAVAEQPVADVRDFIIHFQDRILFGSDNVALGLGGVGGPVRDFDHFASRYHAHQLLWETTYTGESPIEDPDAGKGFTPTTNTFDPSTTDHTPTLHGLNLPPEVLTKLYRTNAEKFTLI